MFHRLAAAVLFLAVAPATAEPIFVVTPSETEVEVGSQLNVDVSLTNLLAPMFSFQLELLWDPSILEFTSFSIGGFLGNTSAFQVAVDNQGLIDVEDRVVDIDEARALQSGLTEISLFTLQLNVIGAGDTLLFLRVAELMPINQRFEDGFSFEPNPIVSAIEPTAVPEPATLSLLAVGLLASGYMRRKRVSRRYDSVTASPRPLGRTLRRRRLKRIFTQHIDYYRTVRTHMSLEKDAPNYRPTQRLEQGKVLELRRVCGLHHEYVRMTA